MRVLALLLLTLVQAATPPAPGATIRSGAVTAQLHLPDSDRGYYRGTRFDWSGVIAGLEWNGHQFVSPWFEAYDPLLHDAITGPVEEFLSEGETSLGYDDAAVGEAFVRIGVGAVRKPQENGYQRFRTYEIVDPGTWSVDPKPDAVTFRHQLGDTRGYAYDYTKTVRVRGRTLELRHTLANTGSRPIDTSVYDHNFFTIDRRTTGPDVVVRFPFEPRARRPLNDLAAVRGRTIAFLRPFQPKDTVFTELDGFAASRRDFDIRIENTGSGGGVRITADHPIEKLIFWAAYRTACPEPYIALRVPPGGRTSWTIRYELYELPR